MLGGSVLEVVPTIKWYDKWLMGFKKVSLLFPDPGNLANK